MEAGSRALDSGSEAAAPTFQVHATRRCNLRCLHCYSESSPWARDTLTHEVIIRALAEARDQGYRIASFSGGEPVLYRGLGLALRHAKSLGMRTTVTSNGMLLKGARLDALRDHTDVLAISLDGVPESHDRMRSCPGAFDRMAANLDAVRATGIDFGFIFTLTLHNVHELAWAADFALSQGAKLFQIHPLEEVGRAAEDLPGSRPDELESAFAYIESERIRRLFRDRLFVQFDLFHREHMARCPERFYAEANWSPGFNLAECVSPLVLEADGNLAPMGYGFAHRYAVGCVRDRSLRHLASEWIAKVYPEFRELCRGVYAQAMRPSKLPFVNWYEMLHAAAAARDAPAAASR
jgi:MoaA/NifB/PqqE/SkfB family radical SAM enzyme